MREQKKKALPSPTARSRTIARRVAGYISPLDYFPHVLDSTREELGHCNGSNLIASKLSKGFLLGGEIEIFIVLRLVRVVSHSFSNREEGLIRESCMTPLAFM